MDLHEAVLTMGRLRHRDVPRWKCSHYGDRWVVSPTAGGIGFSELEAIAIAKALVEQENSAKTVTSIAVVTQSQFVSLQNDVDSLGMRLMDHDVANRGDTEWKFRVNDRLTSLEDGRLTNGDWKARADQRLDNHEKNTAFLLEDYVSKDELKGRVIAILKDALIVVPEEK